MTANAKSKTYGAANPALDAVVVGAVNGDTLDYSLATTAVKTSGVGSYPIAVTLGTQPELHGHQDRRGADGQPGGGDGDGQRQEQDLRRRQPGARCGGGRRGQRRHARLQPGDDGGADLGRRQLPDHGDARARNPNYTVTKTDAALTVNPAVATVTANAKSKTYGDANPALDAVVVGAVNGDTLDYSLATTAATVSGVGSYPIAVTLGTQPELHGHQDRRGADGQPGGGDGDGQRQEQDLRRRQSGARCGGGRRGQRRHAGLQPGDDGGEDLGRRQLPDHGDARHQPELHGHQDRRGADGQPGGRRR